MRAGNQGTGDRVFINIGDFFRIVGENLDHSFGGKSPNGFKAPGTASRIE